MVPPIEALLDDIGQFLYAMELSKKLSKSERDVARKLRERINET